MDQAGNPAQPGQTNLTPYFNTLIAAWQTPISPLRCFFLEIATFYGECFTILEPKRSARLRLIVMTIRFDDIAGTLFPSGVKVCQFCVTGIRL